VQIKGSIAIVTGASSGIGAATALRLAEKGATVVGVARREDRLADTIAACRRHTEGSVAHAGDVSSRAFAAEVVAAATARFGRADILVNNAGISPGEDPVHRAADDVEAVMGVNFFGAIYLADAVLPGMIARGHGSIVNVTSVAGYVPTPDEPAYGASKAALSRWSHGLAIALHDAGVHVGVLSPGPIDTEIWEHTSNEYHGKLFPATVVADGIVRMIEKRLVHLTVPRRFGAVGAVYPLVGRPLRWGLRRYAAAETKRT
jgi:NAD(P)-dependent dehydrogenase (short-subunit alcohol dehydrogenase family)